MAGGDVGNTVKGSETRIVGNRIILDNYSAIYLNGTEGNRGALFHCASGLGPNGSNSNDNIGNVYFNGMLLTTGKCNGFVEPRGANFTQWPGVFTVHLCGSKQFNTSIEGIYTCMLKNSSMMNQSVSVGIYFSRRSKLL